MSEEPDIHTFPTDAGRPVHDAEHDQVGTVEVQILLSWFFETATPVDVAADIRRAA